MKITQMYYLSIRCSSDVVVMYFVLERFRFIFEISSQFLKRFRMHFRGAFPQKGFCVIPLKSVFFNFGGYPITYLFTDKFDSPPLRGGP